jgi:peptidoglycan/LPS O-acetylase OafA/YrhL
MKSNTLPHPQYRPDIDGLRAVAVLSVVAFHAFPAWMQGGFIGVDVFFVISGFLISKILFKSIDREEFSLSDFYVRRVKRIFPALLVVLISSFVIGWFVLLGGEYKQLGKHIAGGAGFISNLILWGESGYFDSSAETKPLLHLWSLGIEEQFYIIWPLVLYFSWKIRLKFLGVIIFLAALSFFLNVKGVQSDSTAAFYSPQTRAWELLSGSLLAWLFLYKKDECADWFFKVDGILVKFLFKGDVKACRIVFPNVASALGCLLLGFGFWWISKSSSFPGVWAVVPVLGALLVIASGPSSWINSNILSNKFAVWFGLISFPLYLWHWPLLSFARIVESGEPDRNIRIAAVVISVVLAWLTYKIVERPFRYGGYQKSKVTILIFSMIAVGSLGLLTYERDGFPFRLKSMHDVNEMISNPLPFVDGFSCGELAPELSELKTRCKLSKDKEPSILFVGDSHANHYRNAVWDNFSNDSVMIINVPSCLPFSNDDFLTGECEDNYYSVLEYLKRNQSVKTVVLSGYWEYLMSGGFGESGENWRVAKEPTNENIESFKDNAGHFISSVISAEKDVLLLKDVPNFDFNIERCFDNRPFRITSGRIIDDCSIDEAVFLTRLAPYDAVIEDLLNTFPSVDTYNPRKLFCKEGRCMASDGHLPYYYNSDHVNKHGASMVIEGLIDEYFER